MQSQNITILDTTLRDGQQCPGAGMSFEKNIEYAKLVARAGIDVIEVGFPAASRSEFMMVKTIAEEIGVDSSSPKISALCQLRENQMVVTQKALFSALPHQKARLHTYLPVDPQLMRASLGKQFKSSSEMVEEVYRLIRQVAAAGFEVEFSPEGYSRMAQNFDFVTDVIRAAVTAGASIINCPDTVGGACKWQPDYFVIQMQQHAKIIQQEFPDKNITWSAHCHNDFGLALENTMNAIFEGPATQIEGCFNGIGERAGNVALEQCVMYLKHFGKFSKTGTTFFTNVNPEMLQTISDFVSKNMLPRQPHWPITGENAAKHSSGGHTNAIIKNPLAYQPFDPKEIGNEITFVFGPLSGGNHAKNIIEKYNYACSENEKAMIAQYIKDYYAERRKGITDQELIQAYLNYRKPIKAINFDYSKKDDQITLKITGEFFQTKNLEVVGQGKDSALSVLHQAIRNYMPEIHIEKFHSQSQEEGIDSYSQSKIVVRFQDADIFTGIGVDQDIEISALKALIDATNQAYIHTHFKSEE